MRNASPRFMLGKMAGSAGERRRNARQSWELASSMISRKRTSFVWKASTMPLRGVGPGLNAGGPRLIDFGFSSVEAIIPPIKEDFHSRAGAPASGDFRAINSATGFL